MLTYYSTRTYAAPLITYFESSGKCFHEKLGLTAENDLVKIVCVTSAADDDVGEDFGIEKPG
jgi:hypothetical protein